MTDLHTHILPGIDDGAKTVEDSLTLLRMERSQGVDAVVLTPHFYRDRENPKNFLRRRRETALALGKRILELPKEEREALPELYLGAEVAWRPGMADWDELPYLCIGETKNLLLELPFAPWNDQMISQLYDFIGRTGITPVIAHLERYLKNQRPELIRDVLALGVPIQFSGDVLLHPLTRGGVIKLLRQGRGFLLASDCHDCIQRPPNLATAMEVVRRKLGDQLAEMLIRCGDALVQ